MLVLYICITCPQVLYRSVSLSLCLSLSLSVSPSLPPSLTSLVLSILPLVLSLALSDHRSRSRSLPFTRGVLGPSVFTTASRQLQRTIQRGTSQLAVRDERGERGNKALSRNEFLFTTMYNEQPVNDQELLCQLTVNDQYREERSRRERRRRERERRRRRKGRKRRRKEEKEGKLLIRHELTHECPWRVYVCLCACVCVCVCVCVGGCVGVGVVCAYA